MEQVGTQLLKEILKEVRQEIGKVMIGQHEVIELGQLAHFPVCLPIVKEPGKDRAVADSVVENRAVQDIISHDTILHDAGDLPPCGFATRKRLKRSIA